jgi:hypothetical protein
MASGCGDVERQRTRRPNACYRATRTIEQRPLASWASGRTFALGRGSYLGAPICPLAGRVSTTARARRDARGISSRVMARHGDPSLHSGAPAARHRGPLPRRRLSRVQCRVAAARGGLNAPSPSLVERYDEASDTSWRVCCRGAHRTWQQRRSRWPVHSLAQSRRFAARRHRRSRRNPSTRRGEPSRRVIGASPGQSMARLTGRRAWRRVA